MIYPPRAESKVRPVRLPRYDNGSYYGQAKFNGSHAVLTPEVVYNRHKKVVNWKVKPFVNAIICGEFMNKGAGYEGFHYLIFDMVEYKEFPLYGTTYEERYNLMQKEFKATDGHKKYAYATKWNGIGLVKSFDTDFQGLYEDIVKVDILEGLVLKRKNGVLNRCLREGDNKGWQLKIRKPTKNYSF
jgi:hypothetical protein